MTRADFRTSGESSKNFITDSRIRSTSEARQWVSWSVCRTSSSMASSTALASAFRSISAISAFVRSAWSCCLKLFATSSSSRETLLRRESPCSASNLLSCRSSIAAWSPSCARRRVSRSTFPVSRWSMTLNMPSTASLSAFLSSAPLSFSSISLLHSPRLWTCLACAPSSRVKLCDRTCSCSPWLRSRSPSRWNTPSWVSFSVACCQARMWMFTWALATAPVVWRSASRRQWRLTTCSVQAFMTIWQYCALRHGSHFLLQTHICFLALILFAEDSCSVMCFST
mmetsp:Transcript_60123/g.169582  ORF Transcript_60123/g.169582 Transcript_60123/m.169582 type:complete len:283 (-) Transcript_60123:129-977(-)